MDKNNMETWEIFMKLCEEFPELYDKYVGEIEHVLKNEMPNIEITPEDKERAWKMLQEKIRNSAEES